MRLWNGKNRRADDPQNFGGIWMVTFTDTIALMLTFFVMTYAMSDPHTQEWRDVSTTLQNHFNRHDGGPMNRGHQDTPSLGRVDFNQALDLGYLQDLVALQLENQKITDGVTLTRSPVGLVLSLDGVKSFETGMAGLSDQGRNILYALSDILQHLKNRIEIGARVAPGTDDGWQLALSRSAAVSAALLDAGYTHPVAIRGGMAGVDGGAALDIVIMEDDGNRVTVFDSFAP